MLPAPTMGAINGKAPWHVGHAGRYHRGNTMMLLEELSSTSDRTGLPRQSHAVNGDADFPGWLGKAHRLERADSQATARPFDGIERAAGILIATRTGNIA